LVFLYEREKK